MDFPDEIKYNNHTLKVIPGCFIGQCSSSGKFSTIGRIYKSTHFDCESYLFVATKRFYFMDGTQSRMLWKIDLSQEYYGWNFNHDFQRRYMGLKLIKILEDKRKLW